jgi:hypothetical protein
VPPSPPHGCFPKMPSHACDMRHRMCVSVCPSMRAGRVGTIARQFWVVFPCWKGQRGGERRSTRSLWGPWGSPRARAETAALAQECDMCTLFSAHGCQVVKTTSARAKCGKPMRFGKGCWAKVNFGTRVLRLLTFVVVPQEGLMLSATREQPQPASF